MNFHAEILGFVAKIRIGEKVRFSEQCGLRLFYALTVHFLLFRSLSSKIHLTTWQIEWTLSKKKTWNYVQKTPYWDNTLRTWCKPAPCFKPSVPKPVAKKVRAQPWWPQLRPRRPRPALALVQALKPRPSVPIWDLSYVVQLELWGEPRELPTIHNRYLWSNIRESSATEAVAVKAGAEEPTQITFLGLEILNEKRSVLFLIGFSN